MKRILSLLMVLGSLSVLTAGDILSGKITASDGKPLEGIRVTDGFTVALSNAAGQYQFKRHPRCTYLSVIVPADRDLDPFFKKVTAEQDGGYDFALTSRPKRTDFSFIQFSDHETGTPFPKYFTHMCSRGLAEDAAFIVSTGDLCRESGITQQGKDMKREKFGGIRAYVTVGNHDIIGKHGSGEQFYEEHIGPSRYAFEEGNVLFLAIPMYSGDVSASWSHQELAGFIRSVLDSYPQNQQIFFLCHYTAPFMNRTGFIYGELGEAKIDIRNRRVLGMAYGHTHQNNVWNGPFARFWNTGQSHAGGGGNAVGSYRIFRVKANGDITTELVNTNVNPLVKVFCDPNTGIATAVAYASGAAVTDVRGMVNAQEVSFRKAGNWLWTASFAAVPGIPVSVPYEVTATFSDKTEVTAKGFSTNRQNGVELEKLAVLPGRYLFGTPVVSGNILYAGTIDEENGKDGGVVALDTRSGELLWKTVTGYGFRNSVLLHDGRIYACDCWNTVYVLDAATGKLIHTWVDPKDEQNFERACFNAPVIGDGVLFAGCGYSFRAIELATGKVLWNCREIPENFGSTMPIVYRAGKLYVAVNWGFLNCVDAKTGKLVWTTRKPQAPFMFQPTFCFLEDGNLFLKDGRNIIGVLNPENGQELNVRKDMDETDRTCSIPLEYKGRIYWGNMLRSLVCTDLKSLQTVWTAEKLVGKSYLSTCQYRGPEKAMETSPILVDGKIVAVTGDGIVNVLNPENGARLASFDIGGPVLMSPVYANGRLYVLDYTGRLFVLKL